LFDVSYCNTSLYFILSRFMDCASELHLKAVKKMMWSVKSTSDFSVKFTKNKEFKLVGFSNSDWRDSIDDMRSISCYCLQEPVAQSIPEAEFITATAVVNQDLWWLRKTLMNLNLKQRESTKICWQPSYYYYYT